MNTFADGSLAVQHSLAKLFTFRWQFTKGCEKCYYTGYKGRKAVYEVVPVKGELSEAVKEKRTNISDLLAQHKIKTLRDSAISLLLEGVTSLEDILPLLNT